MDKYLDIITSVLDGNFSKFKSSFEDIMSDKVDDAFESVKKATVYDIFNSTTKDDKEEKE